MNDEALTRKKPKRVLEIRDGFFLHKVEPKPPPEPQLTKWERKLAKLKRNRFKNPGRWGHD
jgi:hypothetical protein